ncbi:MerR family transcriptional regulator [Staphylococcus caeli]|uniref:MerR family transcriptional regulator n=1 Tax=Staphylococcus caeli TaxID=2201815 RepID=UPI003F553CE3
MYTVKETASLLNMSEHTIRYYSDCGLIPTLKRNKNNQRLYNQASINWLIGIRHLKECSMSIKDIKNYVALSLEGERTVNERYALFLKLQKIALEQLAAAQTRVEFLDNKVKHYEDILNERVTDDTMPNEWKT